ncbi:hypothetical protein PRK78_001709 [Emydomyces testavorans]|uniref:PIG-P domain-containing protein n=1 Tax=Emydomyces testavorans TaxID=2070801 RepID=A0AAF0DD63_9EURO|nr:hypothetical protein PRK78_001709 [Emydomyces testavorans]
MAPSQPFPPLLPDQENLPAPGPYLEKQSANNDLAEEESEHAFRQDTDFRSHYTLPSSSIEELDEESGSLSDAEEDEDEDEDEDNEDLDGDDDDNDDDDDDDGDDGPVPIHRPFSQSTGSLPNAFAPPFYNRPPTPLPPSPSLTSLLRPSFSANTSRPTTPDSSDVETPNDTEAVVAKSARIATTVPRVIIYLLWSFLPSPFLHQLGIYYYPNRWWSLAIPSFLVMTIIYIYVALAAYNTGYLTLPMNSIENLVDDAANIAVIDSKGRRRPGGSEKMNPDATTAQKIGAQKRRLEWKAIWNEGTDAVMDIPIGGVCEVLYGGEEGIEGGFLARRAEESR